MDADSILRELESIQTLAGVLRWAHARTPAAEFLDVVAHDEFARDVVVLVAPQVFAVFDTT